MTSDNVTAKRQVVCPHCGADSDPYPPSCDVCGGDLAAGTRRSDAQHAMPARTSSLWSATEEAECTVDVAIALARAREVMVRHGGTASMPSANRIDGKVYYKSGYNLWIPVRYDITVSAIPAGPRRASVRVNATLDAGGSVANLLTIVTVLLVMLFTAGLYCVMIALVSIPAQKQLAVKVARLVLDGLPKATEAPPDPRASPAPPPRPEPAVSPAPPAKAEAAKPIEANDAFTAIRRLAELRDMGAISIADFEAKKAELLRTI